MVSGLLSVLRSTLAFSLVIVMSASAVAEGIEIATIERENDVDFQKDILPVLRKKCLACHNETDAESDLVLESPAAILKGGFEGPSVIAGNSDESLLLNVAAHRAEPIMPPEDNDADAENLTPEELGLLKLWIDQGAKASEGGSESVVKWQPLPPGVNPVYAVAMSGDGRFVAAGRANQVFLYQGQEELGRLSDDELVKQQEAASPGIAHLDIVQSLAISPDGQQIASGGYRTLKLWQREPALARHESLREAEEGLVMAAHGQQVVVGDSGGKITLHQGDKADWQAHDGAVHALAISQDGQWLASLGADKQLKVWKLSDGTELLAQESSGSQLVWQGNHLAVANGPALDILSLDAEAKQLSSVGSLTGHAEAISAVTPLGDNSLVSADAAGSIRVWQLDELKQLRELQHGGAVAAIAVSPDGSRCVSGGESGSKLWNLEDGSEVATLTTNVALRDQHQRQKFAFEVAQQHVANAKKDLEEATKRKTQEEENLKKVEEARKKADEDLKAKTDAEQKAQEALKAAEQEQKNGDEKVTETQSQLESAEGDDAKKAAQEAADAAKKAAEELKKKAEEAKTAATKATDEKTAATRTLESSDRSLERAKQALATADEAIKPLQEIVTNKEAQQQSDEAELKQAEERDNTFVLQTTEIDFSPNGTQFAVGTRDGGLFTFATSDGQPHGRFHHQEAAVAAVDFVDDGRLLAVDVNGSLCEWRLQPRWSLQQTIGRPDGDSPFDDRITALAFGPAGKLLAVGGGEPSRMGELKIVDVEQGTIQSEIKDAHSDTVFGIAFSPDGKKVASCGADRFMKVFDISSGELLKTFEGHTHHVLDVAWQADGRVLATAGADKVVKVWDMNNGSQIRTIEGFGKEVTSLDFAGTSNRFFAACGDRSLYRCDTGGKRDGIGTGSDFLYSVSSNLVGDWLVFAGHDSVVRMVNADGKEAVEHPAPSLK